MRVWRHHSPLQVFTASHHRSCGWPGQPSCHGHLHDQTCRIPSRVQNLVPAHKLVAGKKAKCHACNSCWMCPMTSHNGLVTKKLFQPIWMTWRNSSPWPRSQWVEVSQGPSCSRSSRPVASPREVEWARRVCPTSPTLSSILVGEGLQHRNACVLMEATMYRSWAQATTWSNRSPRLRPRRVLSQSSRAAATASSMHHLNKRGDKLHPCLRPTMDEMGGGCAPIPMHERQLNRAHIL